MPAVSMRSRLSSSRHSASSSSSRAADRSGETHQSRQAHGPSREQYRQHQGESQQQQQQSHDASGGGKARTVSNFFGSKPKQPQQQQQHWARTKQDDTRTAKTTKSTTGTTAEKPPKAWKSAVDAKTGRTYYYDSVTRQTQWHKPLELATDEERRAIQEKEAKQRDFFAAMEANILKSMAGGSLAPAASAKNRSSASVGSSGSGSSDEEDREEGIAEMTTSRGNGVSALSASNKKKSALLPKGLKPTSKPVRTISSMDNALIAELAKTGQKAEGLPFDTIVSTKISPQSVSSFPFGSASASGNGSPAAAAKSPLVSHLNSTFPPPMKRSSSGIRTPPRSEEDKAVDEFRRTADEMAAMTLKDGERLTRGDGAADSSTPKPSRSDLKSIPKPTLQQRNTCGTLYVSSTMSDPDKDATIKCVCGIYRAHILQAAYEEATSGFRPQVRFDEYEIFNDVGSERGAGLAKEVSISRRSGNNPSHDDTRDEAPMDNDPSIEAYTADSIESIVPSLDEITAFYSDVFRRSQMETDCIIMSLIYIERLIKITVGGVRPRIGNWRSVLFASMVMSSKVWDDLSMWNADFSQTCPSGVRFPLKRINELELAMLNCLKFDVKVRASEYAKYYFLLRSMCIRSGLAGHDLIHSRALDIEGAKKIEDLSSKFQHDGIAGSDVDKSGRSSPPSPKALGSRSKSAGEVAMTSSPNAGAVKVNLEKIIPM
mmetsp:Transcript_15230/g.30752  ORF Transcript_15230/g.30752 Transcript_15230/m.30752 type:complete len:714 (-) Transcript_15230:637-2778(-)